MKNKKINHAYKNYKTIASDVNDKNLYILSGRYKFMKKKYKSICTDIFKKLDIQKSDDIFDIGTGDGEIIKFLSKKSKSSTTIDSPEIINKIPKSKKITYLKGNVIKDKKIIKKKFDKILVYSVIQYFYSLKEILYFINFCIKLLKKSGTILIGDIPNKDMNLRYLKTKSFIKQSKIFDKNKKKGFSKIDKKFHQMFNKKKCIILDDKKLLFLLKKYNNNALESYILPQKKDLPYSVNRVDLLIKKRS
tara:strand:- start:76 stop:819 length:744 start_codon:yes stop_codon:yes gene_type:complete